MAGKPVVSAALSLRDLAVGDLATVVGYVNRTAYVDSLLRLGLIPGTEFEVLRKAPLGDPLEIRFRGYALALRPSEASDLLVQKR